MPIPVFDAASSKSSAAAAQVASLTWSHTCTGSNLILIVGTGVGDASEPDRNITGITYNGVPLTKIREDVLGAGENQLWYLINPATGAHNVVVSFQGNVSRANAGAISLTGAKQSAQPDANNGATGTSTAPSVTVVPVEADVMVIDVVSAAIGAQIVGPDQTNRWNKSTATGFSDLSGSGSTQPQASGNAVMSWTLASSRDWIVSAVSIAGIAGGPPGVKTVQDVAVGDIKTINDVAIADVKTLQDAAA